MKSNFREALVKMGEFLPINMDPGRLNCLMKFHQGHFKRDYQKKKMLKKLYTDEQKTIIKDAIHKLNNLLMETNKETIPLKLYEYYYDEDDDE